MLYVCTIIVPVNDNDGVAFTGAQWNWFEGQLLDLAGGFTRTDGYGAWRNDAGEVQREPVHVFTFARTVLDGGTQALAAAVVSVFDQDAVYYSIGDRAGLME